MEYKKNNPRGDTFVKTWLEKNHSDYRPWCEESHKGSNYCYCKWCKSHITIHNLYGKNGHLSSSKHLDE